MEMSITNEMEGRLVVCRVTGAAAIGEAVRLLAQAAAHVQGQRPMLLIDLLDMRGGLTVGGQYELGVAATMALEGYSRVGVAQNAGVTGNSGFGALVAQNRGLDIKVFDNLEAARGWLLA